MKFSIAKTHLEKILVQRNGYMVLAFGSILLCLIQSAVMFFLIGREKIILIPPSIEKSFWVSSKTVSPEYLAEMTAFFANLRFNMTPDNVSIQRETILRYTDPVYYDSLKSQLVQEADKISDQHITMAFFPVNVKVSSKNLKAIIDGDLKTFVGDTVLPTKRVSYQVSYRYDSGRLLVKSFEEVKHD